MASLAQIVGAGQKPCISIVQRCLFRFVNECPLSSYHTYIADLQAHNALHTTHCERVDFFGGGICLK